MAVPITVGIPTWARGTRVIGTIERILACAPPPAEIIVHVDASDGTLEKVLSERFPQVRLLSSPHRVGPGGGRHRCLLAAAQPYFASFDDDSWPVDGDYFGALLALFAALPDTALLAAPITHPWEQLPPRSELSEPVVMFTGCGWAVRRADYLACPGFVDRPFAYGVEELDLALQFYCSGLGIRRSASLRVFHDTTLAHHRNPRQTAASIQNVALLAWMRYPWSLFGRAILQIINMVVDQIRRGRYRGVVTGLIGIPWVLCTNRHRRSPAAADLVVGFLTKRGTPGRCPVNKPNGALNEVES